MKQPNFDKQVKAGIAFLDHTYGRAWRRKIKLASLDLSEPDYCVLAQTGGDYISHARKLELDFAVRVEYGFAIADDHTPGDWDVLTRTWKKYLRAAKKGTVKK